MLLLIAFWALVEGVLFFIVADVAVMAFAIRKGTRKAFTAAGIAALFASLGGMALYSWAAIAPSDVNMLLVMLPGIDQALVEQVQTDWQVNGALGMFLGSFTGVPYKLYAYAAGTVSDLQSSGMLFEFAVISFFARLPRFILVAVIAGEIGPRLVKRFGERTAWAVFAIGWIGFYSSYWSVMAM